MYLEALILGLLIGRLRGGRISNFLSYPFRYRYFALSALAVFVFPYFLQIFKIPANYAVFPYIAMMIVALIVLLNYRTVGMKTLFVGLILNLAIMGLNEFRMPIDTAKLSALGEDGIAFVKSVENGEVLNYRSLPGSEGLSVLFGKVIALPPQYPFMRVLSVGDIAAALGIVMITQGTMLINRKGGDVLRFTWNPRGK